MTTFGADVYGELRQPLFGKLRAGLYPCSQSCWVCSHKRHLSCIVLVISDNPVGIPTYV